jgi:hypothetical protein
MLGNLSVKITASIVPSQVTRKEKNGEKAILTASIMLKLNLPRTSEARITAIKMTVRPTIVAR